MTQPDEYQVFLQQVKRDMAQLGKQYKAFEELKSTLETLKLAAAHDPNAARRLESVNALHNDKNFQTLCAQAEKDLRGINRQMESLNKQMEQTHATHVVPAEQAKAVEATPQPASAGKRKGHKPQFV